MPSPSKKPLPHLTGESQAPFPRHRAQVLSPGSQNRPQPRVSAATAPRPTRRPGGSEALSWGKGAILGGRSRENQSPCERQGAPGRPAITGGPHRAGRRSERLGRPEPAASAMLHLPHDRLLGGLSPRRLPQPESSSPSRKGS